MTTRSLLFEIDDVTIEALVDGNGPLVVMIASLGRPAQDFDDLSRHVVAGGYTAVRPQPRGIGRSVAPMLGVSLSDLAGDVAMVIERLAQGPAVLVGHAFGQRVARMLATAYPVWSRGLSWSPPVARFQFLNGLEKH